MSLVLVKRAYVMLYDHIILDQSIDFIFGRIGFESGLMIFTDRYRSIWFLIILKI